MEKINLDDMFGKRKKKRVVEKEKDKGEVLESLREYGLRVEDK